MNFVPITIKVDIKPVETELPSLIPPEKAEDGCFRLIVFGLSSMDIDAFSVSLLQTNYPALRDALAQYLSLESSIKALKKSLSLRLPISSHHLFLRLRSDGEIEREEFGLYDVKIDNRVVFKGINDFPPRKGQQWYQTVKFKEIALLHSVTERIKYLGKN